jgi:hypothetical protein
MFSRTAHLLVLFLCLSSILPSASLPQSISSEIYETEEDLKEGLERGYLTLDEYLELLDMLRSKLRLSADEADKLNLIPDVSSVDLLKVSPSNQDIVINRKVGSFLAEEKEHDSSPLSGRVVWRLQQDMEENGETENFLLCEIARPERLTWRMEADHVSSSSRAVSDKGAFRVRKRLLRLLLPEYSSQLDLGNFERRVGLGLNVGYHPLLHYSTESERESNDSFLYPVFGRYNGVCAQTRVGSFSGLMLYSRNKGSQIEDQLRSLDLSYQSEKAQIGVCLSDGKLSGISSGSNLQDDCGSLHLDLKLEQLNLSGEYALLSNKARALAFDVYASRKFYRFDLSWWKYDDDFIHPHGGGISNPDYETIYLEEIDYDFRARQAGERGVFFKSSYEPGRKLSVNLSFSQWRERSYLPDKMKLRVGTGYRFSSRASFEVSQLWADYDLEDEETDSRTSCLNLRISPHRRLSFDWIANFRSRGAKDYGDLRLKTETKLLPPLHLAFWLKYYDSDFSRSSDGSFSFLLQEEIEFLENYLVSLEYATKFYQDRDTDDTKRVRVKVEMVW